MQVITYQTPNDANRLDLTADQVDRFDAAGVWPRTADGAFCNVHHGLHEGIPDLDDDEVEALIAGETLEEGQVDEVCAR